MALNNKDYTLYFVAGDTEYIRLNVKDRDGNIIDVSTNQAGVMGIKRYITDDTFLIPEKAATFYTYNATTQPYTIEFKFTSDDTLAILNYDGKVRSELTCRYDIEVHDIALGANDRTTLISGKLNIKRSIGGVV